MNAYISNDLNMVRENASKSYELSMLERDFLNKGGTIEVLRGPDFKPKPERNEPTPSVKVAATSKYKGTWLSIEKIADRMKYVSSIAEFAKTMTIDEVMQATGKSESAMRRAASEGDFRFVAKAMNPENDRRLIERLSALRDAGISRRMACKQAQISPTLICRLEQDYDFVYPKRWAKGKPPEDV